MFKTPGGSRRIAKVSPIGLTPPGHHDCNQWHINSDRVMYHKQFE